MIYVKKISTPLGMLVAMADMHGITGLRTAGQCTDIPPDTAEFPYDIPAQLDAYFAGQLREFTLPLYLTGTPFQLKVWAGLQRIPYGDTITYAELARRVGQPTAYRAVGGANGRNPVMIIVPCHRVIAANGLGGYSGGLDTKRALLQLESGQVAEK